MNGDVIQELESLIASPGWLRVVKAEDDWWREQMSAQLALCASEADDVAALNKMRQIIAAQRAVQRFMERPKDMIARLKREGQPQVPSMSRGGL